ncbi:MAG: GAF domain-containing protein, partial [Actinobacteria bacterium]|nr:GAF domain-containing protein [Actinomycetota bacterium]
MRVGKANGQDWLRLSEAAAALGVSPNTLRRWSDTGKLVCYRSPGGHRRYRRADVEALLRAQSREGQPAGATGLLPAFTAGDGDLDLLGPPLSVLAQVAAEGVGATSCVFALLVGEGRLRIVAGYGRAGGLSPADGVVLLEDAPAPAEVLRNGRRLVIADLTSTSLLARGAAEAYREQGEAALLALPLIIGGRHAGVMQLSDSRAPRAFTGANVAFAEFMARQAARLMAGDGQRPEEDAAQEPRLAVDPPAAPSTTRARNEPARAPRTVLHGLAERLRGDLGAVACDVLRYDRDERALTLVAATASAGETPPLEGLLYPVDDAGGVADALAGDTVTLHDLAARDLVGTPLLRFEQNGARSALFVPVRLGDDVIGVLEVFSADPRRALDARELALVETATALAALALQDAAGETTR